MRGVVHFLAQVCRILILMLSIPSMVAAQPAEGLTFSLHHFETLKANGGDSFGLLVRGMEEAFGTINAILIAERRTPLYCQPESLALNGQNILGILEDEVKRTTRTLDTPLSFVLLDGLKRTFPCRR